jgi:hypothetical protein
MTIRLGWITNRIGPVRVFIVLMLTAVAAAAAPAQESMTEAPPALQDDVLDRLQGDWQMVGTMLGDSVAYDVTGSWVLGHQFLLLDMVEVSDPPEYEAAIYIGFDATTERYIVHWLDDFGGGASTLGYGRRDGDSIAVLFEAPTMTLRDTFTYDADHDRWHLLIEMKGPDGAWSVFADNTLARRR